MQVLKYEVQNGTTLNYNWRDVSEKFKFTNTDFKFHIGYQPVEFNNVDKALELSHETKFEPGTGKLAHVEGFKFGTTKLGPLGFWTTVSLNTKILFTVSILNYYKLRYLSN